MKINRLAALAVIAVLAAVALSVFAVNAFAQTSPPEDTPEDEAQDAAQDAAQDDGPGVPISGNALDTASAAALEYVGGGRVTSTEVGDEEGYYEIEVVLDDGRQVDVHLDENFNVLSEIGDGN